MERRFDMSDFEQSLKDHADQFRLIPSKRVWNGIYNNLHPGSKWPSITVAIIFLITLITVGNLNNSEKNFENKDVKAFNSNSKATNNAKSISDKNAVNERNNQVLNSLSGQINKNQNQPDENISRFNSADKNAQSEEKSSYKKSTLNKKSALKTNTQISLKNNFFVKTLLINQQKNKERFSNDNNENVSSVNEKIASTFLADESETLQRIENEFNLTESFNTLKNDLTIRVSNETVSFTPAYIQSSNSGNPLNVQSENKSSVVTKSNRTNNKKLLRKKNKNIEWTFYVTPLISSVSFDKKNIHPSALQNPSSVVVLPNQSQSSFQLIHNARLGFETGAQMAFKFSKKFGLITGANINYSSYNNISNFIHPTYANLILTDKSGAYQKDYITHYGNGQSPSQIPLTNYNLDISIPIGLQYNIWKNGKIQIDISSVIEPSAVLKSDAFIISSDGRYYVNDPSLIRKFNVGAAFGAYITFKAKKINWHLGPDFRYQLLSTYKNIYSSQERFIDYGIRIGISK